MTTDEIRRALQEMEPISKHFAGLHNSPETFSHECLACDHYRIAYELKQAIAELHQLNGRVTTLLSLCGAIEHMPDFDPASAYVTVAEIRRTLDSPGACGRSLTEGWCPEHGYGTDPASTETGDDQ